MAPSSSGWVSRTGARCTHPQAAAHGPGLPQMAPVAEITRVCVIASLSELDPKPRVTAATVRSADNPLITRRDGRAGWWADVARVGSRLPGLVQLSGAKLSPA